jgi:hypothetical protein
MILQINIYIMNISCLKNYFFYTSSVVTQSNITAISSTHHQSSLNRISLLFISMIDNVITKEVNQIFSALQNDDHTMKILSNDDDFLSFQSFSESEENIHDVQSSNNEEMSKTNDFDDTFTENQKLSDQNEQNDQKQERNINFKNLTSKTQQRLLNMTVKKIQSSVEEDDVIVNFRERNYHTEYTIKYLHLVSRFIIKNAISSLFASKSSIKSLKSIFNSILIRTYVEIVRNNKKNKKWKSEIRIIAEKSCYLLILDKKSIEDILNLDFNSELNNSSYHFIDSYESRIAERHIWFIQSMNISNERKQTAALFARNHYEWKKNVTYIYAAQCKKYVENRIQWEWKLIKVVINSSKLKWSSVTFSNKILHLINSKRIHLSKDLRQMMKEEDNVK